MKIQAIDTKKLVLFEQDAYEITKNATSTFKINGVNYYLANCILLYRDLYEATFMSKEIIEIELEVVGDDICQENVSL